MEYKLFKSKQIQEINTGSIIVQNLFFEKKIQKLSIAKVKIIGEQKFGYNKKSDIVYYVLQGNGKFHFKNKIEPVKKGDLIFIPKNTKYKDSGKMSLLAISTPKFDRKKHVHSEE